jgi:alkanesulfonate monooxygenase
VFGLWDSWDDDAFVRDRASGRYFDPTKLHVLDHRGPHFSVRGPLNVARPPQGRPVIFQAGSSEIGRELAARIAEGVITPQHTRQCTGILSRLERPTKYDRKPDNVKIMPGLNPIVGRTTREAEAKHRFLQSLIHPDVGLELLSNALGGFDLSEYDIDGPLPDIPDCPGVNSQTSFRNVSRWAREEKLTIRHLYERHAGARGQRTLIGSPVQIDDHVAKRFLRHGVDGFLIQLAYLPGGLDEFVDLVIPELQERGLFRAEYEGTTLRENLGSSDLSAAIAAPKRPDEHRYGSASAAESGCRIAPCR